MALKSVEHTSLGICEHCHEVLSVQNLPNDCFDAPWKCSACGGNLSAKSFGFEKIDGKDVKKKWVGPNGIWTGKPPIKDFVLGNWQVFATPAQMF